jgi:hypothetical protein
MARNLWRISDAAVLAQAISPKIEWRIEHGRFAAKHRGTPDQMPKNPVESGAQISSGQGRSGETTHTAVAQPHPG